MNSKAESTPSSETPPREVSNDAAETVGSHLRTMWRGSAGMLAGSVLEQVLRFGRGILIARGLGAGVLGSFGLLMGVERFTQVFATAGLPQANQKFVADCLSRGDDAGVRATARTTIGLSVGLGFLMTSVLWASAPYLARSVYQRPELTFPLRIAALVLLLSTVSTTVVSVFQAARRVLPLVLISKVGVPVVLLAAVGAVVVLHGDVVTLMGAYAGSTGLGLIAAVGVLLLWVARLNAGGTRGTRTVSIRRILAFSLSMGLLGTSWLVINVADVLILGRYISAEELGVYVAASRTARLVSIPFSALNALYGPTVSAIHAQSDGQALRDIYAAATSWGTGAAFAVLGCLAVAPDIFLGVFGREFIGGSDVMMVLSVGEFVRASTGTGFWTLAMTGGHYISALVGWVGAGALAAGLLIIVPVWRALGAAGWTALVKAATTTASMAVAYRRLKVQPYTTSYLARFLASVAVILLIRATLDGWAALMAFAAAFLVTAKFGWFQKTAQSKGILRRVRGRRED